jgi:hypothetical protein
MTIVPEEPLPARRGKSIILVGGFAPRSPDRCNKPARHHDGDKRSSVIEQLPLEGARVPEIPTSLLTATGLIGGFTAARKARHRYWSGIVAGSAGIAAMESTRRRNGVGSAVTLGTIYAGALWGSHPLAGRIGAWPSVLTVTALTSVAAHVLSDRPPHRGSESPAQLR